jgi:hydroxymethylbilane synthase
MTDRVLIATRGSALALAQANQVLDRCRTAFPGLEFQLRIVKTTGDKLQTASLAQSIDPSTKGLFTKELEVALREHQADLAVHSLKDLPTDLPDGLILGAVCRRADVADVLIYRDAAAFPPPGEPVLAGAKDRGSGTGVQRGFRPGLTLEQLPSGATIATSSTRRQAQLLALRPDLNIIPIRGNVGTRLQKLLDQPAMDATILAAAGLERLKFQIDNGGHLLPPSESPAARPGPKQKSPGGCRRVLELLAARLSPETMLPCVGQGAIGIETRANDDRIASICARLDHDETHRCVIAERAFLRAMGGGCQSPVAAYAQRVDQQIRMRVVSFRDGPAQRAEGSRPMAEAVLLGEDLAARLAAAKHQ